VKQLRKFCVYLLLPIRATTTTKNGKERHPSGYVNYVEQTELGNLIGNGCKHEQAGNAQ